MVFDELPIWVQCHNVPLAFMHSTIIMNVGERIGRVLEIDATKDGSCVGKFSRVRIMLDITQALKQGIWIRPMDSKEEICIILVYERLPQFCYSCGRLGHVIRECDGKIIEGPKFPFGNWLRAPSGVGDRKTQYPRTNSPIQSGSRNDHSHEESKAIDEPLSLTLPNTNTNTIETTSAREESGMDEFQVIKEDLPTSRNNGLEKGLMIMETSKEVEQHHGNTDIPTSRIQASKVKWKRLARGEQFVQLRAAISLVDSGNSKHLC